MRCPYCSSEKSKVIDSRLAADGAEKRRRHECRSCRERFTTYERVAEALPQVVKRSGDRVAFDFGRIRSAIRKAIEKRPVTAADVDSAIGRIRRRLPLAEGGEIPSARIGEWVMAELRHLDPVAYVRFAAGRRRFVDLAVLSVVENRPAGDPAPDRSGREPPPPGERGPQLPLLPRE